MAKKERKKKTPIGLDETFIGSVASASTDDLKNKIVQMQQELGVVEEFLKENDDIQLLRGKLSKIEGPSKDAKKALNNRTKHLLKMLGDRGAL